MLCKGLAPTPMTCGCMPQFTKRRSRTEGQQIALLSTAVKAVECRRYWALCHSGCRRGVVWLARMACGGRDICCNVQEQSCIPSIQAGCLCWHQHWGWTAHTHTERRIGQRELFGYKMLRGRLLRNLFPMVCPNACHLCIANATFCTGKLVVSAVVADGCPRHFITE